MSSRRSRNPGGGGGGSRPRNSGSRQRGGFKSRGPRSGPIRPVKYTRSVRPRGQRAWFGGPIFVGGGYPRRYYRGPIIFGGAGIAIFFIILIVIIAVAIAVSRRPTPSEDV